MKSLKNQMGMSLIEILVVLGIISTVFGTIYVTVIKRGETANIDATKNMIREIQAYVKMYKNRNKKYPDGLQELVDAGYYDDVPEDPWGQPFMYEYPGSHGKFDIYSLGPDEDDDGDNVTSWESSGNAGEEQ